MKQIIDGDTTEYLYDAANRLAAVDGVSYTFDDNGNLLTTGTMTNTWDSANRLIEASRNGNLVQPIYNGVNNRVAQTIGTTTTHFALDVQGLPEVIYTSNDETFIHLPGVIVTESAEGDVRYLLSDGLGSVRQVTDENADIVSYQEFDPYGNQVNNIGGEPYGYTGEWFESYIELLYLRARWYAPETGTFLSVDPVESEPPYQYVRGNPINLIDPSGNLGICFQGAPYPGDADPEAEIHQMCRFLAGARLFGHRLLFKPYNNRKWDVKKARDLIMHTKHKYFDEPIIVIDRLCLIHQEAKFLLLCTPN